MNKIIKNTGILMAITLVAGALLGLVYEVTKIPIAQAQEDAKQEAYRTVLADADTFVNEEGFKESKAQKILNKAGYVSDDISEVVVGQDTSGETVGYVITVTSHEGYGGDIQVSVGIQSDGTVTGVSFLSLSETAGLGMKAKEPSFYEQYVGKNPTKFAVSKDGGDGEQIDALSGATITSRAVTGAVNAALGYYQNAFGQGGN
jgi:electron transport complex protein RnfG